MATKVYVWVHPDGFSQDHPGHCAIQVNGTYISFHPGADDGFKWNAAQATGGTPRKILSATAARTSRLYSYEDDYAEHGRKPEHTINLIGLANESSVNVTGLKNAFQGIKYSFAGWVVNRKDAVNCVQATMMCLDLLAGGRLEGYSPVFPLDVAEYAYVLRNYLDS